MDPQDTIEARFRALQDALPVQVRVARAGAMLVWARGVIAREIVAREGPLPESRLKWETALRMYGADAASRSLIRRMLDDASA